MLLLLEMLFFLLFIRYCCLFPFLFILLLFLLFVIYFNIFAYFVFFSYFLLAFSLLLIFCCSYAAFVVELMLFGNEVVVDGTHDFFIFYTTSLSIEKDSPIFYLSFFIH